MKVTYKTHDYSMNETFLVCSPVEALTIMDALRRMATADDTHPRDRLIAERMLADMRGESSE